MPSTHDAHDLMPLSGCVVVERAQSVACAYAGRLLAAMGAKVVMVEPEEGSPLRNAAPLLPSGDSALFAYLAAGKHSVVGALPAQRDVLFRELERADIFIDDTPVAQRKQLGIDPQELCERFPKLVYVSVLPFGASGPKADWQAEEINLVHASGEGFLLPNGLSNELFPDRAPLKIYGHFASYQGGAVASLAALSALWAAPATGGQFVDVSVQDAMLSVGCFALQRLGDGSLEHRASRRFRYGGVFETRRGYVELLTLEERQWQGLVKLLGDPEWARDEALRDGLERSRRGDEINRHIRSWMAQHDADEVVRLAQELGVPVGKYRAPADVLVGAQEQARGLFAPIALPSGAGASVLVAPFQFRETPLDPPRRVPKLGDMEGEP